MSAVVKCKETSILLRRMRAWMSIVPTPLEVEGGVSGCIVPWLSLWIATVLGNTDRPYLKNKRFVLSS